MKNKFLYSRYKMLIEYLQCIVACIRPKITASYNQGIKFVRQNSKKVIYYQNGLIHRDILPAMISADASYWFQHGKIHREYDLPAVVRKKNGSVIQEWRINGKLHRVGKPARIYGKLVSQDDLPAIIEGDVKKWYKNGYLHREGDKPAFITEDVLQEWYISGELHRDSDKPASIRNFYRYTDYKWYQHGENVRKNSFFGLEQPIYVRDFGDSYDEYYKSRLLPIRKKKLSKKLVSETLKDNFVELYAIAITGILITVLWKTR